MRSSTCTPAGSCTEVRASLARPRGTAARCLGWPASELQVCQHGEPLSKPSLASKGNEDYLLDSSERVTDLVGKEKKNAGKRKEDTWLFLFFFFNQINSVYYGYLDF